MVILCKRSKSGGFSTVFEREESKVYQTGSCRLTPRIWKKLGRAPPPPLDLWVRLKIHKVRYYYQLWDKPILRLLANPRSWKKTKFKATVAKIWKINDQIKTASWWTKQFFFIHFFPFLFLSSWRRRSSGTILGKTCKIVFISFQFSRHGYFLI